MTTRQHQLHERATDFTAKALDGLSKDVLTAEEAREVSRNLVKAHAAATALECSLRGDDPKVG